MQIKTYKSVYNNNNKVITIYKSEKVVYNNNNEQ